MHVAYARLYYVDCLWPDFTDSARWAPTDKEKVVNIA
jgi:undecaprenyl pyrophosphate synthase